MSTSTGSDEPVERRERLAHASERRAHRDRTAGLRSIWFGIAVSAVPFLVLFVLWARGGDLGSWPTAIGGVAAPVTLALVVRGRRMRVAGAERLLAEDSRAPIVYLRPFDADSTEVGWSWRSRLRISPLGGVEKTYEERLARRLRNAGPFVAIGDPTEGLPQLGAARVYAADEDWQQAVDELTERASVILVHAGESEGVAWEIHHVLVLDDPERLILSLPLPARGKTPPRRERYDAFRRRFGDAFPRPLPDRLGDCQFVYFDPDWTPRLLGLRGAALPAGDRAREIVVRRLAADFKITWAPLWVRTLVYFVPFVALAYVLG